MAPVHADRSRRSHLPVAIACVAALTLVLAACGGGGSEKASGVASLGGGASTTTTPKSTSSQDTRQLWLDAAACMRQQGVDFPDPTFDANGRPEFGQTGQGTPGQGGPGGLLRSNDPKIQAARKACQGDFDKIRNSFPAPTPAETAKRKQQLLDLAACMRQQGVDFPDPTFDANGRPQFGQGGGAAGATGADRRNDPAFQQAMQTCRTKLGVTGGFGFGGRGGRTGGGAAPSTTGNA